MIGALTGACAGAVTGAADGFMWGAIGGAVTGGMNSPHCFVAGTLVCTVDGEVPIEDIELGDYTTEGHPFYTLERGFVKAGELRYSDTLVDDNGKELHLEKKNKEHLIKPVTVYNFAVEDYHTYFVGESEVLVHNMCAVSGERTSAAALNFDGTWHDAGKAIPKIAKSTAKWITKNGWKLPK